MAASSSSSAVGTPPFMDGDRAGTGAQAARSFDVGEGVVGGVLLVEGGGGTEGEAPGEAAETVMANFWPDWQ
ncbi:unnamed protein product [Malus baccata var. baccata]